MNEPPKLPDSISNDGREIWNWAHEAAKYLAIKYKISELRKEINVLGTKCGDCAKWITDY